MVSYRCCCYVKNAFVKKKICKKLGGTMKGQQKVLALDKKILFCWIYTDKKRETFLCNLNLFY